jgi:VPDSG-CTERM motif
MKKTLLIFSVTVLALTARGTTVFDTFGPGNTYDPSSNGLPVWVFAVAAQFTAGASGNLSTIDLGLTYSGSGGPASVYLYGDAGGSPDNANQIFLGSVTPIAAYGSTNNSVVSLSVAGTVPVSIGSVYWLVLKGPAEFDIWNSSSPTVGGTVDLSFRDSPWFFGTTDEPAFRITVGPASVPDAGSTLPLLGFALAGLGILRRKLRC